MNGWAATLEQLKDVRSLIDGTDLGTLQLSSVSVYSWGTQVLVNGERAEAARVAALWGLAERKSYETDSGMHHKWTAVRTWWELDLTVVVRSAVE